MIFSIMNPLPLPIINVLSLKGGFHGRTNINEINHRCINIGRQVTQTCRHRPMEIGAVLAADFTSYFVIGRPEKWLFG